MPDIDTAEYRKLALIAAGVSLQDIPPIIDTATWRKMMIAALLKNTANQAIAGRVDYYGQLPVTTGNPPIGTTYLVLNSSGIYYINYKSAGVYVKLTDTGSLSDWVYAPLSAIGTLPDVTLTNPQVGQTLTWNGTRWVNTALPSSQPNLLYADNIQRTNSSPAAFDFSLGGGFTYGDQINGISANSAGSCGSRIWNNVQFNAFFPPGPIIFFPTSIPAWNLGQKNSLTFNLNLGSNVSATSFIRIGWSTDAWVSTTTGWRGGGTSGNIFGNGIVFDFFGNGSVRAATNNGGTTLATTSAPNQFPIGEILKFTIVLSPNGSMSLFRTNNGSLILSRLHSFGTATVGFFLQAGCVNNTGGGGAFGLPMYFQVNTSAI